MIRKLTALVLAALLLMVAGCGGKQSSGGGSPTPKAETKPILIGTSVSLSGTYAASAKYALEGYLLWEDQVNKRGGLLERPV